MKLQDLIKQATPLPWTKDENVISSGSRPITCTETHMRPQSDAANAILIVHAVNMLPKLVAFLDEISRLNPQEHQWYGTTARKLLTVTTTHYHNEPTTTTHRHR